MEMVGTPLTWLGCSLNQMLIDVGVSNVVRLSTSVGPGGESVGCETLPRGYPNSNFFWVEWLIKWLMHTQISQFRLKVRKITRKL